MGKQKSRRNRKPGVRQKCLSFDPPIESENDALREMVAYKFVAHPRKPFPDKPGVHGRSTRSISVMTDQTAFAVRKKLTPRLHRLWGRLC